MTQFIPVSSAWLARREAEDARARSRRLVSTVAALVGNGPIRVHDLGSGTGSMARWLAPRLPGPQTWTLHDWNAALTARAVGGEAIRDADGAPVTIDTRTTELGRLRADHLDGASLVTASALLDVLTADEVRAIVAACVEAGAPLLAALSVTGRVELDPPSDLDRRIASAFDAHQRRRVDGRELLGPSAVDVVTRLFDDVGWTVESDETPWRLGAHEPGLLTEWLTGRFDAAEEQDPGLHDALADDRERRAAQRDAGTLSATVHHVDLLARP